MTDESDKNGQNVQSTPDLKKLEREDFNNIIGVYNHKNKPKRNKLKEQVSKVSTLKRSTIYERYNFGNLEDLLVEEQEG